MFVRLIWSEKMISLIVLILAVSLCLWYIIKFHLWTIRMTNMTSNIPGPKPLPIIGNALIFAKIRTLEGDYKLPKGLTLNIRLYELHRNPKIWSHPNEFNPDHFLPEEISKRPKGSYLPFSWGPRSCPGSVHAMISIKTAVSAAIRRYKFETDMKFEKLEYKYNLLLEPVQAYSVRIRDRKTNC